MVTIREIESSSSSSTSSHEDLIESSLAALVQHYRQPIHVVEQILPYYYYCYVQSQQHPVIASAVAVTPFLGHVLSRLEGRDWTALLNHYATTIRPILIVEGKVNERGVSVLQHYELLIAEQRKQKYTNCQGVDSPILSIVCQDLTLLTTAPHEEPTRDRFIRTSIVLPTLLRLLLFGLVSGTRSDSVVTTLMAVGKSTLHPRLYIPDTNPLTTEYHDDDDCVVPLPTLNKIEWLDSTTIKAELDGFDWNDPETNLAAVLADECWGTLGGGMFLVCESIGWTAVAKQVRAYFFARDHHVAQTTVATSPKRPLTYPLQLTKTMPSEPAHQSTPCRVYAALQFISILPTVNQETLEELLPICYTLVDSHLATHVSLGASALTRLLTLSANQDVLPFQDSILSVLQLALKVARREAPVLGLLGLAFSVAFTKLPHCTKERRQTTATLLSIVEKNQYAQSDHDGFFLSVVMGGLIPLLHQHAQLPNADTLELGRAGLRTLLPLVSWNFGLAGKKLQVASLVALTHLLWGAYPIVPGHGGQLMSELLACWGHAHRASCIAATPAKTARMFKVEERLMCQSVLAMAKHAAVVTYTISGDGEGDGDGRSSRAHQVLQRVLEGDYDMELKEHVQSVKELAAAKQSLMNRAGTI
jgi:hypothetical protein